MKNIESVGQAAKLSRPRREAREHRARFCRGVYDNSYL